MVSAMTPYRLVTALLLALGLIGAGWFVGNGLRQLRSADRYVAVKGLAEREVAADLVIWPISFFETGNDLNEIYPKLERSTRLLREFLAQAGLNKAEITQAPPSVFDLHAQRYGDNNKSPFRYRAEIALTVRSKDPKAVKQAMQGMGELIKQGIAFTEQNWEQRPEYLYTSLNQIKPALLVEATQNARKAAEQFALDSGSRVGNIRTASQGQISINDRDRGTPEIKLIRVVTTIEYSLVND